MMPGVRAIDAVKVGEVQGDRPSLILLGIYELVGWFLSRWVLRREERLRSGGGTAWNVICRHLSRRLQDRFQYING